MRYTLLFTILLVILSLVTQSSYTANIEDGLWLYLPLNEGRGETVRDHGPHNFDTEFSPDLPEWVDADHELLDDALKFDGKTTYIKIDMHSQGNDIDSHYDEDKGITICAWVNVVKVGVDNQAQTRQPIVIKGFHSVWEFGLLIYDNFGVGMSVWTCPGLSVSETSSPNHAIPGTWIHQCGTFKLKVGSRVYLNAEENPVAHAEDRDTGACETGNRSVFIAHREDGQYLNAEIAEVYIWDRVIDIQEMKRAMTSIGGLAVHPGGKLTTTWGNVKRR